MFIPPSAETEARGRLSDQIGATLPLDFQAGFAAAWTDTRNRLLSTSGPDRLRDRYDAYIDEIHRTTGQRPANPLRRDLLPGPLRNPLAMVERQQAEFDTQLDVLAQHYPGLTVRRRADLEAELAVEARAGKAQADKPTIGWGGTGRFLGGAAAAMTDPINLAAMLFASPVAVAGARATLAAQVGRAALVEGAVNAGTEAAIQPFVASYNQRLDIDYGAGDVAAAIGGAAAGGAVLGGAGAAVGAGLRALVNRSRRQGILAARPAGTAAADLDTAAAETVLDHAAARQDSSPFPPTPAGDAVHAKASEKATRDILSGGTVDVRDEIASVANVLEAARNAPLAHPYAAVARMEPADIEAVLLAKGPAVLKEDGAIVVEGRDLQEPFGNRGRGAVKILWRHGEMSPKAGTPSMVTADDVLRTPLVIRAFDPARSGKGQHANLKWIVERPDGRRLAYVAEKARQGGDEWEIVTIHVIEGKLEKDNPLSPRRQGVQFDPDHEALVSGQANGPLSRDPSAPQQSSGPLDTTIAPAQRKPKPVAKPLPPELAEPPKVPTLATWFRAQGGIKDEGGWLARADVVKRLPGLINNRSGQSLDDAALDAWEAGFLHEFTERPTIDQMRNALLDELGTGAHRVRLGDMEAWQVRQDWEARMAEINQAGIDPRGMTMDEVTRALLEHHRAEAEAAPPFDFGDTPARTDTAHLDVEAPEVQRVNTMLLEDDMLVPVEGVDDSGVQILRSAHERMRALDDELDAWVAAEGCWGRA